MRIRVRVSVPQQGALECRQDGGLADVTVKAWRGRYLEFDEADREALWDDLNDVSNAEDADAEQCKRRGDRDLAVFAGRASRSLGALASRVLLHAQPIRGMQS